jgi:CubicO group peptidase (beta-lactamase class C family)
MLHAVLALMLAAATSSAQMAADSVPRWVDTVFAPYATTKSPGCAVGVTRNGTLSFAKAYGMADLQGGRPVSVDTRFYIASVSKQFTAMSIMLLSQEHRLGLDDPVRKWVPELSVDSTITLRQLLNHTSGLRDYFTLLAVSGWQADGELTEKQFLDLIKRQKSLNFKPGEEFLYSNTGYALLALVVQRVSGQSLRDFAHERIFAPLGMTHTEFRDDHTMQIPESALGYQLTTTGYRVSQPEFDVVGDGGVYSTVGDLAKWEGNYISGQVGGQDAIALMQTPGRLANGQPIPYGFAITLGSLHGEPTFSHSGAYGGFRSTLLRIPGKGVSVITLCNTATAPFTLAEQVASLVLGVVPQKAVATTLDIAPGSFSVGAPQLPVDSVANVRRRNAQAAELAGTYYSDELDLAVSLAARDGVITLRRAKAPDIRFTALSGDLYTSSDQIMLAVLRDTNDAITGFTLSINRVRDLEFVRRVAEDPPKAP